MPQTHDLLDLIGSRICHALISPLGAIGNGVELLSMTPAANSPELALIAESVTAANARIRFYRVAFGAAGEGQRMGRPEVVSILADTTRGGRLTIEWAPQGDPPRAEVKLAFLLIQCLETAMPYGGRIAVTQEDGRWLIRGTAPRMKVDPGLWALLETPDAGAAVTAAQVHFMLAPLEMRRADRQLAVDMAEGEIRLVW